MRTAMVLAAAAFAALLAPREAAARFDDTDARHACRQAAVARHGADRLENLTTVNRGGGQFNVTGTLVRHGRHDVVFRCRYDRGEVSTVVKDEEPSAAAVGLALGVVAGAAILGAVSDDHRHQDWNGGYGAHGHGWNDAYSPMDGTTCYRRERACYHDNGRFAPKLTRREFGAGAAPQQSRSVAQGDMPRFCEGEASARFHVSPREILTLPLERTGGGFAVYGQFPPEGRRVTTFVCHFDSTGRLTGVNRT